MDTFMNFTQVVSQWAIPGVILAIIIAAWIKRVPVYESFVTGAKEGFDIAIMIIPYLVAILAVVGIFRESGALNHIKTLMASMLTPLGLAHHADKLELLPMALIRPLSGSGATGVMVDLFKTHGPDSFIGFAASIMQGSTETTFYVLTVYYGSVGIKRMRHTLPACLLADATGLISAVVFAAVFYAAAF